MRLKLSVLDALLVFLSAGSLSHADTLHGNLGKKIANFTLTAPLDRAAVSLADFKDKKAIVVVFVGTECPLNNQFLPRLAELHKEYSPKGVQFLAINSNRQDTLDRVAVHARKHNLPFPVVKDPGNKVADAFGARRTPEAFVLDGGLVLRYQGRIDDQYGIDIQRPKPTRRDLAEALDDVLAGKEVRRSTTPVAGCLIARMAKPKADGSVTYTKQVARILQKNCQECHRPGQIGPMALMNYDDAAAWSGTIREVVAEGRMPPWYADPRHGKFANDRRLKPEERDALLAWVEQGCPPGRCEGPAAAARVPFGMAARQARPGAEHAGGVRGAGRRRRKTASPTSSSWSIPASRRTAGFRVPRRVPAPRQWCIIL